MGSRKLALVTLGLLVMPRVLSWLYAKSKLTVAHLLPWPGIGGTEHATLRIARAAAERGYRNIAFYRRGLARRRRVLSRCRAGDGARTRWPSSVPSAAAVRRGTRSRCARAFRAQGVDLVHCADIDAALQVAPAGRLAGVPVLCHIRNPWTSMLRREALVLSAVDTFVFVSRDTWATFAYRVGPVARPRAVRRPRPQALPTGRRARRCGASSGSAEAPGDRHDGARLGRRRTTSRSRARRSACSTPCPDARFVIVGDHERHAAHREHYALVQRELERLGVAHAFIFTGFRTDVARVMGAFDVFVLSTHFEGLPLVILEAMAMELPVVATAVNGIPELITANRSDCSRRTRTSEKLADQLLALLRDPARARRIAAGGTASCVERQFSARAFGENIAALYADALRGRARAAARARAAGPDPRRAAARSGSCGSAPRSSRRRRP